MIRKTDTWFNPAKIFIDLWSPLMDYEKELITRNVDTHQFMKGDYLYKIGETPLYIMFVLAGRVKLVRNSDEGYPKIIRIFRDDQFFGYRSYFARDNYTNNCIAMENTRVATLPVNVIGRLVDSNKNIMRFFFKELATGLGMSDDRIVSMTQKHLRGRLAETLIFIQQSFGTDEKGWINGKITRRDIANLANMTTSNAIRTLTAFRQEGIIETDGKKIRISNPADLIYVSGKE